MEENTTNPLNRLSNRLIDPLLEILISAKKSGGDHVHLPITLNVGGMLITGDLISSDAYLKDFPHGDLAETLRIEQENNELLKQKTDHETKEKEYDFIHLKNAKLFIPGHLPIPGKQEGTLWRGRLRSVNGFIMGSLDAKIER